MRPGTTLAVAGIALIAFVAAGCGGPSAQERATKRAEALSLLAPELRDRLDKQAEASKTACENEIGDLLDSVGELDSRLDVGLTYTDYSSKVADVNVAYDRVDPSGLTGACLNAAAHAENALNNYISAQQKWDGCIEDTYCDTDSITPGLQALWSKATAQDEKAKAAMERVAGSSSASLGSETLPATSSAVGDTIYGTITKVICENPDPPATAEPCANLRNTLAGGVTSKEEGSLQGELDDLLVALGLKSS
jgi:hypothetical protein